jgi:hypothetical protein
MPNTRLSEKWKGVIAELNASVVAIGCIKASDTSFYSSRRLGNFACGNGVSVLHASSDYSEAFRPTVAF